MLFGVPLSSYVDAFHAAFQPAGQAEAAEVVHSYGWAWQEEDGERTDADSSRS